MRYLYFHNMLLHHCSMSLPCVVSLLCILTVYPGVAHSACTVATITLCVSKLRIDGVTDTRYVILHELMHHQMDSGTFSPMIEVHENVTLHDGS